MSGMSSRSPTQSRVVDTTTPSAEMCMEEDTTTSNSQLLTQMSSGSGGDGASVPPDDPMYDMFGEDGEYLFWDTSSMVPAMDTDGTTVPAWSSPDVDQNMSTDQSLLTEPAQEEVPEEAPAEEVIDMVRIQDRSHQLFNAMDGWGTNEDGVLNALRGLSTAEITALEAEFQAHYGQDLRSMIESEMGGDDLTEAEALMTADPVDSAIAALNNSVGFWNDDEAKIEETLRGLSDTDRALLLERMPADQLETVRNALGDWMPGGGEGADVEVFDALIEGNSAEAAAVRLDEAMGSSGSWYNPGTWGTDEEGVYSALESVPVEDRALVTEAFNQRMSDQGIETDLNAQIDAEFSGAAQDIATHLEAGEDVAAQAARIMDAGEGMGTNEQAIFDALSDPRLQSSDPSVRDAALAEREELLTQFESMYGRSMDDMLSEELDELDTERASQLQQGGELDPAFAIYYASEAGWGGTDEDMIRGALSNRSTDEIAQIQADYDAQYASQYGASFDATLDAELSGRDSFDVGLLRTYGNTNDPEQLVQRMEEQYQFERGTGSNAFSRGMMDFADTIGYSSSAEVLDNNYERLQGCLDEEGNIVDTEGISDVLRWNDDDVADYVAAKESVTEGLATGAEIVAAAIATVLTEGAASPWLVAALGALAGGSAGIAMRAGMGGDAYGSQEFGADAINVLVQTLAAGLTAGVIDPRLEELLADQPQILAAIAQGAGSATLGGATEGMMNEEAWRNGPGDVLLAMGEGAGMATLTGAVGSGVEHVVGGHMDGLVDMNTYSGAATRGTVTGMASGIATTAVDPATYDGRIEDVLGTLALGGAQNAVTSGLSEMSTLHNRARVGAYEDAAAGRERTAEELTTAGWTADQITEYQERMARHASGAADAEQSTVDIPQDEAEVMEELPAEEITPEVVEVVEELPDTDEVPAETEVTEVADSDISDEDLAVADEMEAVIEGGEETSIEAQVAALLATTETPESDASIPSPESDTDLYALAQEARTRAESGDIDGSQETMQAVRDHLMSEVMADTPMGRAVQGAETPEAQLAAANDMATYMSVMHGMDVGDMTPAQMDATIRSHARMMGDTDTGADMRKFYGPESASNLFAEQYGPQASLGGSVGIAENTDGMTSHEVISALGLDYEGSPFVDSNSNRAPVDEAFYVDWNLNQEQSSNLSVPLDPRLIAHAETMAAGGDTLASSLSGRMVDARVGSDVGNPKTGTGGTAHGTEYAGDSHIVGNQELELPGGATSLPLRSGAAMYSLDAEGNRVLVATLTQNRTPDGRFATGTAWVPNPALADTNPELHSRVSGWMLARQMRRGP